jgi:dihydrofolate reductase
MRLITMTQITVDGVTQANGGPSEEDVKNGFTRGGWAMGVADDDTFRYIVDTYTSADAFLFGRKTHDLFAASWGTDPEMREHPIGAALNERPKYLVSRTVTAPTWAGTTVLPPDPLDTLRELKDGPDGQLQVHGSTSLVRWLLANDLVDEMILLVVPVILGAGDRLFPQDGPDIRLDVLESRVDTRGVGIQRYRPAGRPVYRPNPIRG